MVIDVHTHIFESLEAFPERWLDELYRAWETSTGREAAERRKAALDGSVKALIEAMDEAGVDKSVALPLDFGFMCQQEPKISIWRINEYVAEAQASYPNRIIGFVGVDPLRKDAVQVLDKGVKEWGLKGLKLYTYNHRVTDLAVQPLLQKANELELPVLVHQGSDPLPFVIEYGNPADLDTLTLRYPKMKIVAAHFGRGYEDVLTGILWYKLGTIYADLAGLQFEYWKSQWHFTIQLRYWMDKVPDALVMGSDWPFIKTPPLPTHKEWFDAIKGLEIPKQVLDLGLGIQNFSREEKEMILGENARKLLGV